MNTDSGSYSGKVVIMNQEKEVNFIAVVGAVTLKVFLSLDNSKLFNDFAKYIAYFVSAPMIILMYIMLRTPNIKKEKMRVM